MGAHELNELKREERERERVEDFLVDFFLPNPNPSPNLTLTLTLTLTVT